MRLQTGSIEVEAGDRTLQLRLDMTALSDFERQTATTIPEFAQSLIDTFQTLDIDDEAQAFITSALLGQNIASVPGAAATGTRLLGEVLGCKSLSAHNVLALVWALAGGEDLKETIREFGRTVPLASLPGMLNQILQAVKEGMPELEDTEGSDEEDTDEDPTSRPE